MKPTINSAGELQVELTAIELKALDKATCIVATLSKQRIDGATHVMDVLDSLIANAKRGPLSQEKAGESDA